MSYNVYGKKPKAYGQIQPKPMGSVKPGGFVPKPTDSTAYDPSAHAAGAVAYGEHQPVSHDSIYNQIAGGVTQSTGNADADFQYGLTAGQSKYGFKATPTADGKSYTYSELDPSDPLYNPFSALNMLKQHFEQGKKFNTNSYAERGQGYAGSLQTAQDTAGKDYTQGYGGLQTGLTDYLHGITSTHDAAYSAGDTTLGTAGADEVIRHQGDAPAPIVMDAATAAAQGYLAPGVKLAPGWSIVIDPVTGKAIRFLKPGESL